MTPQDEIRAALSQGFDDYGQYVNPLIALRARLAQEPVRVTGSRGGRLVAHDGCEIEDFHGTQAFGHRNPVIADAIRAYLDTTATSWFPSRVSPFAGRLARRLCERSGHYSNAFFGSSGSDAAEAGMKLARAATGRPRILSLDKAYHGTTYGSCALMPPGIFRDPFGPHLPDVASLPFGDIAALERALAPGDVAAVIVEPIQLEGGVRPLPAAYIAALCELTAARGTLLIADEVQTGLGRTGHFLNTETWPRRPDAVLLAKQLGGGLLPCSALLTHRALFEAAYGGGDFERAESHNSTFSGNSMACAAALGALSLVTEPLMARVREVGEHFRRSLREALTGLAIFEDVRGQGLITGIQLRQLDHPWLSFEHFGLSGLADRPSVGFLTCHRMYRRGYYCFVCGHDWTVLRLQPRLDIESERLDAFVAAIAEELGYLNELAA